LHKDAPFRTNGEQMLRKKLAIPDLLDLLEKMSFKIVYVYCVCAVSCKKIQKTNARTIIMLVCAVT